MTKLFEHFFNYYSGICRLLQYYKERVKDTFDEVEEFGFGKLEELLLKLSGRGVLRFEGVGFQLVEERVQQRLKKGLGGGGGLLWAML